MNHLTVAIATSKTTRQFFHCHPVTLAEFSRVCQLSQHRGRLVLDVGEKRSVLRLFLQDVGLVDSQNRWTNRGEIVSQMVQALAHSPSAWQQAERIGVWVDV